MKKISLAIGLFGASLGASGAANAVEVLSISYQIGNGTFHSLGNDTIDPVLGTASISGNGFGLGDGYSLSYYAQTNQPVAWNTSFDISDSFILTTGLSSDHSPVTIDVTISNVNANLAPNAFVFSNLGSGATASNGTGSDTIFANPNDSAMVTGSSVAVIPTFNLASAKGTQIWENDAVWYTGSISYTGSPVSFTEQYVINPTKSGTISVNDQVTGVPELSTWVMMLAGFAGIGMAGFGRNKKARIQVA